MVLAVSKRIFSVSLLLFLLLFLSGCAGLIGSRKPLSEISPVHLLQQIKDHMSRLDTFQGHAVITILSKEGTFKGTLRVIMKNPDSLWFKIEGPLGIDMATGSFGDGYVQYYSPWEKANYVGTLQRFRESGLLPVEMGDTDLIKGILGFFIPTEELLDSSATVDIQNRSYVLSLGDGETVWIDSRGPVVSRWEKKDFDNEMIWEWECKEFAKKKGIRFPVIIQMTNYQPKQRLTIYYETVKANRSLKNDWCKIKIPEGVETIEL